MAPLQGSIIVLCYLMVFWALVWPATWLVAFNERWAQFLDAALGAISSVVAPATPADVLTKVRCERRNAAFAPSNAA